MPFNAILLTRDEPRSPAALVQLEHDQLPAGEVLVKVDYSSLNFKDALAVTGRGAIARIWPLVAGIDLAGQVERSDSPKWKAGDRVVVTGWGIGESHWGGLAQYARLSEAWPRKIPDRLSTRQAMAIGTAGFTAALCVRALLRHGLTPRDGPVLVTGAAGGVGSIAVALLAALGHEVVASTGRPQEESYLRSLGAARLVDRAELAAPGKPLQRETWAGVVDAVGSHTLANACASTRYGGAVAACGLAQGADFPATVMPFILRGVTLYGINSVLTPPPVRDEAWDLLAQRLDLTLLDSLTSEIGLSEVIAKCPELLAGHVRGRIVVDVNR